MIELKNLTKKYKNNYALKEINLNIKDGEFIVIKGISGSGKSTMLSLIATLSRPTSGEVIVDGKRISKLLDDQASLFRRDNIGFIFQSHNLISNLSVKDNILTPLIPLNLPENKAKSRLNHVIKQFNISHKKYEIIKNLSGGERQRVAIARAMINNPKIILADEPTASLDNKLSQEFIATLRELKDLKKTIILATHDPLFFTLDFVDKIVEIQDGTTT
jgi:putative ABC transport system ATP-binding protein